MDTIKNSEIIYKKKIGELEGDPVIEVRTIGGYNMVLRLKKSSAPLLAVGSHRALARYIAKQRNPGINFTNLEKGDFIDEACFLWLVPKYDALTQEMIDIQNGTTTDK
jgi:hypothetical protein